MSLKNSSKYILHFSIEDLLSLSERRPKLQIYFAPGTLQRDRNILIVGYGSGQEGLRAKQATGKLCK